MNVRRTWKGNNEMLYAIAVILVILWALGLLTATFGNLIHILLAIAIIAVLLRVIRGRNPLGSNG